MELAIKGHKTRGAEVIALLEMLGGKNTHNYSADSEGLCFYLGKGTNTIYYDWVNTCYEDEDTLVFSLEEFEEKYPYKVGDKVQHKGSTSCGSVFEVEKMRWEEYTVKYTLCLFGCNNYKRSTLPAEYLQPYKEETMEEKLMPRIDFAGYCKDKYIIDLGDYEIKEENGKTYAVRKQPQYPKTYKECCEVLRIPKNEHYIDIDAPLVPSNYNKLVSTFTKLLICRDAYWRMVGEEMGLGKPWKPDYTNDDVKFCICCCANLVVDGITYDTNQVLTFPTKEMRAIFLENFKDLIKACKELL